MEKGIEISAPEISKDQSRLKITGLSVTSSGAVSLTSPVILQVVLLAKGHKILLPQKLSGIFYWKYGVMVGQVV